LGRQLRALLGAEVRGPQRVELVAPVHHEIERVRERVPFERDDVTVAGREADRVLGEALVARGRAETEDAAVGLEQRARALAGRAWLPIVLLAGVRRHARLCVEVAIVVERDRLRGVPAAGLRQLADDELGLARR